MSPLEWDEPQPNRAYLFPLTFCSDNATTTRQAVKELPHKKETKKKPPQ